MKPVKAVRLIFLLLAGAVTAGVFIGISVDVPRPSDAAAATNVTNAALVCQAQPTPPIPVPAQRPPPGMLAIDLQARGFPNNVFVRQADTAQGWPEAAPFDTIVFNGPLAQILENLPAQVKSGERLIIPVTADGKLCVLKNVRPEKIRSSTCAAKANPGSSTRPFAFYPADLLGKNFCHELAQIKASAPTRVRLRGSSRPATVARSPDKSIFHQIT